MSRRSKKSPSNKLRSEHRPQATAKGSPPAVAQKPGNLPAGLSKHWATAGVCLFLIVIVGIVYGQTLGFEFVNYDDGANVYKTPQVTAGFSAQGIAWAFTHTQVGRWAPVTAISRLLDCSFYGLWPGGHHLTNVLLHSASAIVLFLVLWQMTGAFWRGAFVASVFAVHPLSVESVAWISERGEMAAGLFFVLTLWVYVRYAQKPRSKGRYWAVALLFTLCLMSKPIPVTLPFLLLVLDWWPLGRMPVASSAREFMAGARPLLVEKIPLFAISAIFSVITLLAQAPETIQPISLGLRIENAVVSYSLYIQQMFYPEGLAALYPHQESSLTILEVAGALLLLAAVSSGAWWQRKRAPWFLAGWLWFLGMLLPVIGIVSTGNQSHADRYTYLPNIGLYLLVTWTIVTLAAKVHFPRWVLGTLSGVVIVTLMVIARTQASYWHDSESLWSHTLACTEDNYIADNNLGNILQQKGQPDAAIAHFQRALKVRPDNAEALNNLGTALAKKGHMDEAITQFQRALQLNANYEDANYDLGIALLQKNRVDEAIPHFEKVLRINPGDAGAHNELGVCLQQKGRTEEAIAHFQKALELQPNDIEARNNLANLQAAKRNSRQMK